MKDRIATVATGLKGYGDLPVGLIAVKLDIPEVTIEVRIQADEDNDGDGWIFAGELGVLSNKTNDYVRLRAGAEAIIRINVVDSPIYLISDKADQLVNVGILL